MSNPTASHRLLSRFVLGILAAALGALPARAQYVSTVISNAIGEPAGVATDTSDNVYITDPDNARIAKYAPASGTLTTLADASAGLYWPQGIVATRGGLVVADELGQSIFYVTFGGAVSNLAGQPYVSGNANGPAATALFSYPVGIAADSAGDIFVADSQNGAIRQIDTNNIVSTVPTGGYVFNLPNAVAVDNYNNLWVADSGHDVVCQISNGAVKVVAGISGKAGTNDSVTAASAQFNYPAGLLWDSSYNVLLIDDTGNHTLRRLFQTNVNGALGYAVQTMAGVPGHHGLVNGVPASAEFFNPAGLCVDAPDSGYYIADSGNNAVRVFQPSPPLPPVSAPVLGYVIFVPNLSGVLVSKFTPSAAAVFNNPTIIAIEAEAGTQTYITYGPTQGLLSNSIPVPGNGVGNSPILYAGDGLIEALTEPSIVPPAPDMTIYAISTQSGRRPSPVVSGRYQYITANPNIGGNDAAAITLTDVTENAEMFYTLDGSSPTNDGSNGIGPIGSGQTIAINLVSNITLSVRAFTANFAPSGVVSETLSVSNNIADRITFGFSVGEASSSFIAAAGQRFYAPVTLSLIPSFEAMYTLQFDLVVTNLTGPPVAQPSDFKSFLVKPVETNGILVYYIIPPKMFTGSGFTNVLTTNTALGLLGVGWLERPPETELYDTTKQTLITYSLPHDRLFLNSGDKVVVGGFSFNVPPSAANGQTYRLDVSNPSATSDGISTPVYIQTVTNGSLTNGPINSVKVVTVGSFPYLVGDAAPFRWFNAGDFGDGVLQNDDVTEVFQSAVYNFNVPPVGSDFFDVMDSCNGNTNNLFNLDDTSINKIAFGDGALNVDDVYVTFRRSLDPSLTNYARYWSNGVLNAMAVPTTVLPVSLKTSSHAPVKTALSGPRYVTVAADQVQAGGNLTVQVPIRVLAADTLPIRVAMLNVEIDALDGSPALNSAPFFSAVTNLGSPVMASSQTGNNYAAAWLDSTVSGVSGASLLGTLTVTLPPTVTANSAYRVHFDHFSASPNGLALFHATAQDGLITVGDRTGSSWHDGIPDTWRLLNFGTVSDPLSAASDDPDGDGANNWQEYIAGTNPLDAASVFKLSPSAAPAGASFTLQWPSVVNKLYTVQSSFAPGGGWTTLATNLAGTGQTLQWMDSHASSGARFYRALVQ